MMTIKLIMTRLTVPLLVLCLFAAICVSQPVHFNRTIQCRMRQLAAQYAELIQPADVSGNWRSLAEDALQVHTACNVSVLPPLPTPLHRPDHTYRRAAVDCAVNVFVDGTNGKDTNGGSIDAPVQTVLRALRITRMRPLSTTACITVRAGTYYFGNTPPLTTSSRIGHLQLTSSDSALTIQAFNGETVVFSGGRVFKPTWTLHASSSAGDIYQTPLPNDLDVSWSALNELFTMSDERAIRARWPNGNPSTSGRHTYPSGWIPNALNWLPSPTLPGFPAQIQVSTPNRDGTNCPNFNVYAGSGGDSIYDPPRSFWNGRSQVIVPGGLEFNVDDIPRYKQWKNVTAGPGLVQAFQGPYWGGWAFFISEIINNSIIFGEGGWQEARGGSGSDYYIDNVFEELDSPLEYYVDRTNRILYFMPNTSDPHPQELVVSQLPCIISLHGTEALPVDSVTISGITFSHTANTFMNKYDVPSGGDWSVHRGATLYITGTTRSTFHHNNFTQLGGNAIIINDYNKNTTITHNECIWIGDSCVVIVGTSAGINGITYNKQPTDTMISNNILHEYGIYGKQTSGVMNAVAKRTVITSNIIFNGPRALININDGFYGDVEISHNLLFNGVRETMDHGPINSWDRQVYLNYKEPTAADSASGDGPCVTRLDADGFLVYDNCKLTLSTTPAMNHAHHNLIMNSYQSVWPIDHDDCSSYWLDYNNFLLYGGSKNYVGNNKHNANSFYAYVDYCTDPTGDHRDPYVGSDACSYSVGTSVNRSGYGESWTNNQCILTWNFEAFNYDGDCDTVRGLHPLLANNTYYLPANQSLTPLCGHDWNFTAWQAAGQDIGSRVETIPSVDRVIAMAYETLEL